MHPLSNSSIENDLIAPTKFNKVYSSFVIHNLFRASFIQIKLTDLCVSHF